MKARDPLAVRLQPADRVHYVTGMMLDSEDFSAEQTYHRGRLARALTYLHGYGTIAGLRVVIEGEPGQEQQVVVNPGIALDRLGRVIEVPASSCIRLNRWYEQRSDDDLAQGFHAGAVIVDVFVTFRECERGKTPALAAGPFDALDAVVASRLRDSFEVELVIRHEGTPPQPERQWPQLESLGAGAVREAILDAWKDDADDWESDGPAPLNEHTPLQDTTALLLARLSIPALEGDRPQRTGDPVTVDNGLRPFVYSSGVVASVLGLSDEPS